jgi:hypothetical protein
MPEKRKAKTSKGNRSKGERLEVVLAPELIAEARDAAGEESLSDFVRAAVRERVMRLQARRRREKV